MGGSRDSTRTMTAYDDDSTAAVTASASASVTYDDVAASIGVTESVNPSSVDEGGVNNQEVTYTYYGTRENEAGTCDPLSDVSAADDTCSPVEYVGGDIGDNGVLDAGEV